MTEGARWLLLESKFRSRKGTNLAEVGRKADLRVVATRDEFVFGDGGEPHRVPAAEWALVC